MSTILLPIFLPVISKTELKSYCLLWGEEGISSVNDTIEVHQCKLTVDNIPELFGTDLLPLLKIQANKRFGTACRYLKELLATKGLVWVVGNLESQYIDRFWDFLAAAGAEQQICDSELRLMLTQDPHLICFVLSNNKLVKEHDGAIVSAMQENPSFTVERIVSKCTGVANGGRPLYLPRSLSNSDVDAMVISYVNSDECNDVSVQQLVHWPSNAANIYTPSRHVRVLAERKHEEAVKKVFDGEGGSGLLIETKVRFSAEQDACIGVTIDKVGPCYTYSLQWLQEYIDNPTILNNLIYVFRFIDPNGLMAPPAHKHEESTLMSIFSGKTENSYWSSTAYSMRNSKALMELYAYNELLSSNGTTIESAINWAYNTYFQSEFDITGFCISLSTSNTTWYDKCKMIGSEIEQVVKAYSLYAESGTIDPAHFKYMNLKSFETIGSLHSNKYLIEGSLFNQFAYTLFSDQSLLAHPHNHEGLNPQFFDCMVKGHITPEDYPVQYLPAIESLIDKRLLEPVKEDGRLLPSRRAIVLHKIWNHGAILTWDYDNKSFSVFAELVEEGALNYNDGLFSPDEAAYLNYIYNDVVFCDSLGLRNKYAHASGLAADPNAEECKHDYYQLLLVLVLITLKINDELQHAMNHTGIVDFVDWPYYDESVYSTYLNRIKGCAVEQ